MVTLPTFPSIDFSKLDISKLKLPKFDIPKFDMPKFEMPSFEMPKFEMPKFDASAFDVAALDTDKLLGVLRDAAYVVIGFGVLTVQQAQVRRRQLIEALEKSPVVKQLGTTRTQLEELVAGLETQLEEGITSLKAARQQVLGLLRNAA